MTKLQWGQPGTKRFENGVDHGVLYKPNNSGVYDHGYAWNGLTTVTESPSGAESNKQYADNGVYLNQLSAEEFGGTIEAFTCPVEFEECDGSAEPTPGVSVGQQPRKPFGFSWRTRIGNDLSPEAGYKIKLAYSALAAPSERAATTINDSPEATALSWEFSTTPVNVGTINGTEYKPTSIVTIDSTRVDSDALAELEDILYGTSGTDPRLPTPAEVIAMFDGTLTPIASVPAPTYNATTKVITIPTVTGLRYLIDGVVKTGTVTITADTVVTAEALDGYTLPDVTDTDWFFDF